MALNNKVKQNIQEVIKSSIRNKFNNYNPESSNMPFHFRLLGRDRMALYSFIQSLNTTFGTSIFEPVAVELAKNHFSKVKSQYIIGNTITEKSQIVIQDIMNKLSIGSPPNKLKELEKLRKASQIGKINKLRTVKVDLFVENSNGVQFFFDLKTAKPNISNFKDFKRTLLEWAAIAFTQNNNLKINTIIAIPYNPYEPKPYERWTIRGMIDDKYELLVGEEFWDFLGGKGAYQDLLDCFEKAGMELRQEIDRYFSKFRNK